MKTSCAKQDPVQQQALDVALGLLLAPVIPRVAEDLVKPQGSGLLNSDAGHRLSRDCAG